MEWFETGRVNLYVTSPVNLGKVKQLVCNGFGFTGLIFDDGLLQKVLDTIRVTGEHYVFETGRPLPKKTINNFKKSRGLTIKIGDKSHPKAVEVISSVPDWAEKFDRFVDRLSDFFDLSAPSKDSRKKPDPDYVRRRLGHKSLQSTQIYINMEQALFSNSSNEYHVKIAQSVEQAMALIEVGFEYVTGEYNDGGKIFKKRK